MKHIIFLVFVTLLTACGTRTMTTKIEGPDEEITLSENSGPYSRDTVKIVNTKKAYRECLSRNAQHMGYPIVDDYCRNRTKAASSEVGRGAGLGMMNGMGFGGGFMGQPGVYYAMPGQTSSAGYQAAQQPATFVQPTGATTPSGDVVTKKQHTEDLKPLYKEAARQRAEISELRRKAGDAPAGQAPAK